MVFSGTTIRHATHLKSMARVKSEFELQLSRVRVESQVLQISDSNKSGILIQHNHISLSSIHSSTLDIHSELVCRYVKFYDIMLKCENENVRHLIKYSKYNVHGPLGRNHVHIYNTAGVDVYVATQRRNIRRYTIEKARSAVQDRIDGQRVIELYNQRIENTLAELNLDDINEMIDLIGTR